MTDCYVLVKDTLSMRVGDPVTATAIVGDVPAHVENVGEVVAVRTGVVGTAFILDSTDEMTPAGCWWRIVAPGGYVWDVATPVSQAGSQSSPVLVGELPRRVPGSPPQSWTPVPDGGADGQVLGSSGGVPVWQTGGGGAVDSVNGQTGVVNLDAADVGAAAATHAPTHAYDGTDPVSAFDVGAIGIEAIGLEPGQRDRGNWDATTAYEVGDVAFSGSVFVAVAASTGENPLSYLGSWAAKTGSVNIGLGNAASGDYSTAVGFSNATSGDYSTAVGFGIAASGDYSTAVGFGNAASGDQSTAVGLGNATSGDYSTAVGLGIAASGDYSTAVGVMANAPNDGDVNLGNVLIGGIDMTGASNRAVALPYGALDLPTSADATDPYPGSTRLVGRADGIYVRDSDGNEVGPLGTPGGSIDGGTP